MKCQRCGTETNIFTGSWFTDELICKPCADKEKAHPMYKEAKRIEHEHVVNGNYNFPGIGLPEDLR